MLTIPSAATPLPETGLTETGSASPERIAQLADQIVVRMRQSSAAIAKINSQTRLLSFNAQIEAARAGGTTGAAFGVVASAIRDLSDKTSVISEDMGRETAPRTSASRALFKLLPRMCAAPGCPTWP